MTTTASAVPETRLTFAGVLRSEWIKLRSLRSTIWCYSIAVVVTVGLALLLLIALATLGKGPYDAQQTATVQAATIGVSFAQLVVAVLGVLMITGEYGTGMIRSTLTAVPRRTPALVGKAIVLGVTTFVVSLVSIAIAAFLLALLLPGIGIHPDFGNPNVILPLLGGALFLALLAVLSLSIGAIIRNSAGGIAATLGLLLVAPAILQLLAGFTRAEWLGTMIAFLPSSAGSRMTAYLPDGAASRVGGVLLLNGWQATLVMLAWVAVSFAMAAVLLKRRDV